MIFTKLAIIATLAATALAKQSAHVQSKASNKGGSTGTGGGAGSGDLTLQANAVQTGSANNGQDEIGADAGEAASATSNNNFINNCAGKTLTNGLQQIQGSCNGIPMGDIPAKTNMVSSSILFPPTGGKPIASDTTFNISVQVANLVAGQFTNADATYYGAPQALQGGLILGHTHVTVQDMGNSLNPQVPLDATKFSFFKGINDNGNGQGLLQAVVTGGLPAGNYRVCTLTSAANHQPVLMPVAQRGAQDDCTKFVVNGNGKTINVAANDGSKGIAAAAAASEAVVGATNSAFAASVIAQESAAAAAAAVAATATTTSTGGKGGKGGNAAAAAAAAKSSAAAAAAASKKGGSKSSAGKTGQKSKSKFGGKSGSFGKYHRGRKQRFAKREFVA